MAKKDKLANYYKDLPEGFTEDYCINAKKASVGVLLNVISVIIAVIALVVCWIAKYGLRFIDIADGEELIWFLSIGLCVVAIILYLILFLLTHGLVYKLFTKQKLKFGLTLTVAYCGLREGYVNKKTSLAVMLAPFVLHSIWMLVAICLIPQMVWSYWLILLFAIHVGGCCGYLWGAAILVFKYAGKQVLVSDDGPCQKFYVFKPESAVTACAVAEENKEDGNGD